MTTAAHQDVLEREVRAATHELGELLKADGASFGAALNLMLAAKTATHYYVVPRYVSALVRLARALGREPVVTGERLPCECGCELVLVSLGEPEVEA